MVMAFQLCIFVASLFFYSRPKANGNQISISYNGGHCTTDKQGTYRIALQYCNGKGWLTMQPEEQSVVQPKIKVGLQPEEQSVVQPKIKVGLQPRLPKIDLSKVLGKSCHDIKEKGLDQGDGKYRIDPDDNRNAFIVYCDMTSFGGGWTMCYTTDNHVDIKKEVSSKIAYGVDGYRADCNKIPFTDVMFVDGKTQQKASFTKTGPKIAFIDTYNNGADTHGQWNGNGVASDSLKYQLVICNSSHYKGLFVSGFTNSCYKSCNSWCGDSTSPYFRTAAVNDATSSGVAFNVNGHRPLGEHLISAGIR